MSPFTPFFTEHMYLNLRRAQPAGSAPESVHFCDLPPASPVTDADTHISRVRRRARPMARTQSYDSQTRQHVVLLWQQVSCQQADANTGQVHRRSCRG